MIEQDELLKLDNQLCFALYSAHLAFNQKYRKLLSAISGDVGFVGKRPRDGI